MRIELDSGVVVSNQRRGLVRRNISVVVALAAHKGRVSASMLFVLGFARFRLVT